jgi:hypothetical protein
MHLFVGGGTCEFLEHGRSLASLARPTGCDVTVQRLQAVTDPLYSNAWASRFRVPELALEELTCCMTVCALLGIFAIGEQHRHGGQM